MENSKNFLKERKIAIICMLLFVFAFAIRCFAINLKQDMFVDEMFTTRISSYKDWQIPLQNSVYNGYDLKQTLLALDPSLKSTLHDIIHLHRYTQDTPHTNFYYTLYRLWFNGYSNFDLKTFCVHGCSLNLIFFTVSYLFLYKILRHFFGKNSFLVPFGLFAAYFNTAAVSNTIFIRPYALQEAFFMILTYTVIKYWDKIQNLQRDYSIFEVFGLSLIISFTFLTGYYASLLILLYALLLVIKAIKLKNYNALRFFTTVVFVTGYLIFLLYPGVCFVLFSYRAKEAYSAFPSITNLVISLKFLPLTVFRYMYSISLIAVIMYYLIKYKRRSSVSETNPLMMYIFIISIIWSIAIFFICPYKHIRYIMPVIPMLMLIFPGIASFLPNKKNFIAIISIIYLLNLFVGFSEYTGFKYRKYIPIPSRIEFIYNFKSLHKKLIFLKNTNLPVYIIQDGILGPDWLYPTFEDHQTYYIYNYTPKNIPYWHFYVVRNIIDSPFRPHELPSNYKLLESHQNCADFYVCEEYIKMW